MQAIDLTMVSRVASRMDSTDLRSVPHASRNEALDRNLLDAVPAQAARVFELCKLEATAWCRLIGCEGREGRYRHEGDNDRLFRASIVSG